MDQCGWLLGNVERDGGSLGSDDQKTWEELSRTRHGSLADVVGCSARNGVESFKTVLLLIRLF